MKEKILVTGGTGYIGSHTCVELMSSGYEVVLADNLSNSHIEVLDGIETITGKKPSFEKVDFTDAGAVEKIFTKYGNIKAVIHFAALKAVGESVEFPLLYYRNNIGSLINLLMAMEKHQVKNLVFSSSCTVYGEPDSLPVSEEAPIKKAESPYGATKQMSEQIIEDQVRTEKLKAISLRYFNPTGAHPSAEIGEYPIGVPNNLMPVITQTAIGKRKEVVVFGDNYPTRDGSCIRDYIHVVDLAKAHVVAVERLLNNLGKKACEVFNLGTGTGYSVLETIRTFERENKVNFNWRIGPRRPGDVVAVYSDTVFANEELGWKAELGLQEMVISAWNWEKKLAEKE